MFQKFLKWLLGGRIEIAKLPLTSVDVDFDLELGIYIELSDETTLNWNDIAREYGMHYTVLKAFNKTIVQDYFWGKLIEQYAKPIQLKSGATIYIPSAEELTLNTFLNYYEVEMDAINYFRNWLNTDEAQLLKTAMKRASSIIGKHYGTESLIFLTPNFKLDGTSESRVEVINGEQQFKVNWGADLWKCNIYMHDVVFDAGFMPDVMSNQHYITAGQLHLSDNFEELPVEVIQPGVLIQLYNGGHSNDSHNLVLATFITREPLENNKENWSFIGLGAEADMAAASERHFEIEVDLAENKYYVTDGTRELIRFFKPKFVKNEIA